MTPSYHTILGRMATCASPVLAIRATAEVVKTCLKHYHNLLYPEDDRPVSAVLTTIDWCSGRKHVSYRAIYDEATWSYAAAGQTGSVVARAAHYVADAARWIAHEALDGSVHNPLVLCRDAISDLISRSKIKEAKVLKIFHGWAPQLDDIWPKAGQVIVPDLPYKKTWPVIVQTAVRDYAMTYSELRASDDDEILQAAEDAGLLPARPVNL